MKSILTKLQKEILERLSGNEFLTQNFYLSGGTALSEFYLHHRFSEDFDFFTNREIDFKTIKSELEPIFRKTKVVLIDYQEVTSSKIFFLRRGKREKLKTDFNFWAFDRLETGLKYNSLTIDSLLDIAVNKLHTILTRKTARDFVDFYFIEEKQNYSLELLLENLKKKYDWQIDPLYLASRFLMAENLHDFPKMIKEFNKEEMVSYFQGLAQSLKPQIIS